MKPLLITLLLLLTACHAEPALEQRPGCAVAGQVLPVDIARPDPSQSRHRAVMLVHGGGWSAGSRSDYAPLARALAAQGFTAVSIDYRLSPAVRHPQHLQDVACQFRWLRAQAQALDVDPDRIAAVGGSAGAHLVALLAYASPEARPAAVVLHGGPMDLVRAMRELAAPQQGAVQALFGTATPREDQLRGASPVAWVRTGAPPTLLLHGEQDPLVPVSQARALADALANARVPHRLHVIPGAGHGDFGLTRETADATGRLFFEFLLAALR